MKRKLTFTLDESEIKQAIVQYLNKQEKVDVVIEDIQIKSPIMGGTIAIAETDELIKP